MKINQKRLQIQGNFVGIKVKQQLNRGSFIQIFGKRLNLARFKMSVLRSYVDFKTIITVYYAYFSRSELKIGKSITIFNDLTYLIYPLKLYSVCLK